MLYRIAFVLARALARLLFVLHGGYRVEHTERVPHRGGVLICPNHVCDADPPAIGAAVPRHAYFMAKAELFDVRFLGKLIRLLRAFPVKRDSADRTALQYAEERLKEGEAVVIFPEGGGNFENTLQPLHPGALLVALRARVPVVPVALKNTNAVFPYGSLKLQRSPEPVTVTFGEPLDFTDLYGKKGAVEEATRRLTLALAELLQQPVPEGKPRKHE